MNMAMRFIVFRDYGPISKNMLIAGNQSTSFIVDIIRWSLPCYNYW